MAIPVRVHPFFWIVAALIGWINGGGTLIGTLLWILVIFFSVLIHEYGHALTARFFGQTVSIQLIAMGGLTSFRGPQLKGWKQFLITLNGPLFGFGIFIVAGLLLPLFSPLGVPYQILKIAQYANLFWTVVNLLPILPLDGGHLLRIVLESWFGVKGLKIALLSGAVFATCIAFAFFFLQSFLVGAIFFLFALQGFETWRKSRHLSAKDQEGPNQEIFAKGEEALSQGKHEEAKRAFESILEKAPQGALAIQGAQYLALLAMKESDHKKAYDLLAPIEESLSGELLCQLHLLASEFENYPLVARLSASVYQLAPSQEMALRSARAFAHLKEGKLAGGWLCSAWSYGGLDLEKILQEPSFQAIGADPEFRLLLEKCR